MCHVRVLVLVLLLGGCDDVDLAGASAERPAAEPGVITRHTVTPPRGSPPPQPALPPIAEPQDDDVDSDVDVNLLADDDDTDIDDVVGIDAIDSCPDEPEDLDGFEDHDGCPDFDHDVDDDEADLADSAPS